VGGCQDQAHLCDNIIGQITSDPNDVDQHCVLGSLLTLNVDTLEWKVVKENLLPPRFSHNMIRFTVPYEVRTDSGRNELSFKGKKSFFGDFSKELMCFWFRFGWADFFLK